MSNARYYARRAAQQCPDCGERVTVGVYCLSHRAARAQRIQADRASDRDGYNRYMRVYKQLGKDRP